MTKDFDGKEFRDPECLKEEDFYRYISGDAGPEMLRFAEAHFARCPDCRQDLAELIELLHPENGQGNAIPELSKSELDRTMASIREVAHKEQPARFHFSRRLQWPIAAAAAIGFVALSIFGLKHLYEKNKSEVFFNQARAMLEQSYTGTSPGNLRLSLPFQSTSSNRKSTDSESLQAAKTLFYQAIAVRDNMPEARLGLGYVYLTESKYDRALEEFQTVLGLQKENAQALLGRGVARYEEVIQGSDPLKRYETLQKALSDFDAVLKLNPDSAEARYNRIWTLFESGLHKEALREIDLYLSKDPSSIWAEELKGLRIRIQSMSDAGMRDMVNRAAREKDHSVLQELARQVPHRIPNEIRAALKRSLWAAPETPDKSPSSGDLRWAAETMEAGYSAVTGDHSCNDVIKFYVGLSPPQREIKKYLDEKFQEIVTLHKNGKFDLAISRSKPLESQYLQIKDFWQIFTIHHMRGNSYYMGRADYRRVEAEYAEMYRIALRLKSPELTVRALRSLSNIYGEQRRFDQALSSANRVKDLAREYKLASWQASAFISLGYHYQLIGQFEQSLREYNAALNLAYPMFEGLKIIEALEYSGTAMDRLGRIQKAGAYYQLALREQDRFLNNQLLEAIPELDIRRLNLLVEKGDLAMRTGDLAGAESFLRECLRGASGKAELEARSRIGLAEVYLKKKQVHEAKDILEPAIKHETSGQYPEIEWETKFLTGRILEETGFPREALVSFKDSIQVLKHMRQFVRSGDLRQGFLSERYDPFRAVVRLLSQSSGNEKEILEFLDEAKAMTLNETLERLNVENESRSNSVIESEHALVSVEYFFIGDQLLIMNTAGGHIRILVQNISAEKIGRQVREFLNYAKTNDSGNFTRLARQLYDELISPVEEGVSTHSSNALIILPDGPLYLLPFAGLQDAAGRFLIERTPVAYSPSRTVFRHCLRMALDSASVNSELLLIDGSKGLPKAQEELAYLSNLFGRNASIIGTKDLPMLMGAVEHSGIFHFLGHSTIRQGLPVLVLQGLPKEVILDCQIIRSWKMPRSRLVNLAGCSTGIGPIAEGEAPWGLVPAFLDAGAPAIIASLMDVDDASTAMINCRFYDQLQKGAGIAQALQKAQIALISSARAGSGINPKSWIPYVLVGNPQ